MLIFLQPKQHVLQKKEETSKYLYLITICEKKGIFLGCLEEEAGRRQLVQFPLNIVRYTFEIWLINYVWLSVKYILIIIFGVIPGEYVKVYGIISTNSLNDSLRYYRFFTYWPKVITQQKTVFWTIFCDIYEVNLLKL